MKNLAIVILCFIVMSCFSKKQIDIDHFNILIEGDTYRIDFIGGVYEVFLEKGNQKAFFKPSEKDVESIVKYINENSFLFEGKKINFVSYHSSLPVSRTTITVSNNKSVSTISYCDPCYFPFSFNRVRKVKELEKMIEEICNKSKSVRELPPSDFYLE